MGRLGQTLADKWKQAACAACFGWLKPCSDVVAVMAGVAFAAETDFHHAPRLLL
jgi:hypothetical protein